MSDANDLRGEINLALEGVDYVLRPSYQAIVAMERQTGKSLLALAQAAGDGSISHDQAAVVVTECIKAQGRAIDDKTMQGVNATTIGELVMDRGLLLVAKRLELLLFLAATGGYTPSGEVKATGTNMTGTPAAA